MNQQRKPRSFLFKLVAGLFGSVLLLSGVLLAVLPTAASRLAGQRIDAEIAKRGIPIRYGKLHLGYERSFIENVCVDALPPATGTLACADKVIVHFALQGAIGGHKPRDFEVQGGFVDLSADRGSLDQMQQSFEAFAELLGKKRDEENKPERRDPNEGVVSDTVAFSNVEIRLAGRGLPLEKFTIVSGGFEGNKEYRRIDIKLDVSSAALAEFGASPLTTAMFRVHDPKDGDATANLEFDSPLQVQLPGLEGAFSAAVSGVGFQEPRALTLSGAKLLMTNAPAPLVEIPQARLELRELTTKLEDLYFARLTVQDPVVRLQFGADGKTPFHMLLGLGSASEAAGAAEGSGDEAPEGSGSDGAAGDDAELWAGREWWEKIPQMIEVRGASVDFSAQLPSGQRAFRAQYVDIDYALRAVGLQLDFRTKGEFIEGGEARGRFDISVIWAWTTENLEKLVVDLQEFNVSTLAVLFPQSEALANLGGNLSVQLTAKESDKQALENFGGRVSFISDRILFPPLATPFRIWAGSWEFEATRAEGRRAPLVFTKGAGVINDVQFSLLPEITEFNFHKKPYFQGLNIRFEVPDQPAQTLMRAPNALIGPLAEAQVSGTFGMNLEFPVDLRDDDGKFHVTIGAPTKHEVRDQTLSVITFPEAVDPTKLNRSFAFTFLGPDGTGVRQLRVPSRGAQSADDGAGEPSENGAAPEAAAPADDGGNWVRLEAMSYFLVAAQLYREDGRFFRNTGINWYQLRQVVSDAINERKLGRGASTISMQLVKNVFLTHERTLERKLQELVLTYWMTRLVPKERILEIYMNIIELGSGINGVGEASQHYFGKSPDELTIAEAVWLSALSPAPVRRGAVRQFGQPSEWQMNHVDDLIEGMFSRDWITASERDQGLAEEIRFVTSSEQARAVELPPTVPDALEEVELAPAEFEAAPEEEVAPLLKLEPAARLRWLISSAASLQSAATTPQEN